MSATAGQGLADRLGIETDMVVMEIGLDDDADTELREAVIDRCGEILDEDTDEVVDVVLLWYREEDGDLFDILVDALAPLAESGLVWLLTPKPGRDGNVEPSDIAEAAVGAGLAQTSSISASKDWQGARLVTPKAARSKK